MFGKYLTLPLLLLLLPQNQGCPTAAPTAAGDVVLCSWSQTKLAVNRTNKLGLAACC